MTKQCSKCGKNKSIQEFNKRSKTSEARQSRCKLCCSSYSKSYTINNSKQLNKNYKRWNSDNPGWRKDKRLQKMYGITLAQYEAMILSQDGKCAICKQPETTVHAKTGETSELCVDHCHKTGKVRGLLCNSCNRGIGNLRDNASFCYAAGDYLNSNTNDN